MLNIKKGRKICEELFLVLSMDIYSTNDLQFVLYLANYKGINMSYSNRQYFNKFIIPFCKNNYDKLFVKNRELTIDDKILAFNTFQDPKQYFDSFIKITQFDFLPDFFAINKHSDDQKNKHKEEEEIRLYKIKAFLSSFSQIKKQFPDKIITNKEIVFRMLFNLLYMNIFDHQLRQEMIMLLFDKQTFIDEKDFQDLLAITLQLIHKKLKNKSKENYLFNILKYEMFLTVLPGKLLQIVYQGIQQDEIKVLLDKTKEVVEHKKHNDKLINDNDSEGTTVYKIQTYSVHVQFKYINKFILDNKDSFRKRNENSQLLYYLLFILSPEMLINIYNRAKSFLKESENTNDLFEILRIIVYHQLKSKRLSKFKNIEFNFQLMLISMLYINKHLRNIILNKKQQIKEIFYEIDNNIQILNKLNKIQYKECQNLIYIHDKCIPQQQKGLVYEKYLNEESFTQKYKNEPLLVIEVEIKNPFDFQNTIKIENQKQTINFFIVGAYIGNRKSNEIGEFLVYNHYNLTFFRVGKNKNKDNIQLDLKEYISNLYKESKLIKSIYLLFTPVTPEREKHKLLSKSNYEYFLTMNKGNNNLNLKRDQTIADSLSKFMNLTNI